ncbi:hypothetical protein [Pectinatus frisingensis]|uniref:hypothetical protein n=1 Tax=Pectinatus frisingensis TaxID=865 RepID=UPI0018C530AA|nr:hypothetical protein [Pectinatus frisingensis]
MEVLIIIVIGIIYLIWHNIGDADINFKIKEHTPFVLDELKEDKAVFSTEIEISNDGKQCATIMDCFIRSQLPYEQFASVKVYGKAELKNVPREDDYFEAVLIQKHEKINIVIKITLLDRNKQSIKETLRHVVDIPVDVVYQHTARHKAALDKKRLVLPAAEIAALLNIELVD